MFDDIMNSSPLNIYLKTYLVDILVEIWAWATVSIKKKKYTKQKNPLKYKSSDFFRKMTNKSSIDLDRNIRLSRLSGRFPRVAYQTAQRRVNSTRTRCQKKIATTFAEVSGVVGEQAGIIFEKLGDRSRNRLN